MMGGGRKKKVNSPLVAKKKYKNEKILIILYEQKLCMVCVWFSGNDPLAMFRFIIRGHPSCQ